MNQFGNTSSRSRAGLTPGGWAGPTIHQVTKSWQNQFFTPIPILKHSYMSSARRALKCSNSAASLAYGICPPTHLALTTFANLGYTCANLDIATIRALLQDLHTHRVL